MTHRPQIILLMMIFMMAERGAAQTVRSVSVDLNTGVFTPSPPFDEEFTLTGAADPLAQRVELEYGELARDDCRSKPAPTPGAAPMVCPPPAAALGNSRTALPWTRKGPGVANFSFRVGTLNPKQCYGFRITQHLSPATDDDRKKVREALSKQFRTALAKTFKKGTFNENDRNEIQSKTNEAAREAVHAQFLACLEGNALDLSTEDMEKIILGVLTLSTALSDTADNIATRRTEVLKVLCLDADCLAASSPSPAAARLRKALSELLADPSALTPGSAKAWESPINPSRQGNETTTMIHIARALASTDDFTLAGVIKGTHKIAGASLEPVLTPDPQSILILDDFVDLYASEAFRRKLSSGKTEPVVVDRKFAKRLLSDVGRLAELLRVESQKKQELEKTMLPDFLADKALERDFALTTMPAVITEGKNPYIGADVGIAYALDLDKTFPYFGANFYFDPINKDAPAPHWGKEAIQKRGSILVGLTVGGVDGTKNLFAAGNVMAGVGWRFHRYVKASAGTIVFKQRDANPVIEKDHIKAAPFASVSFDIDLKQFIGGVAKLFGL